MPTFLDRLRTLFAPAPGQTPNLFAASATVLSISAIYLYFAGYIFSYFYYYKGFGVTLESLDLSPQFYFMRAYTCLQTFGGLCLVLLLLLVITSYMGGRLRPGFTLVSMLAAFPLLFYIGHRTASSERDANFCSPSSTIRFRFKEPAPKTSPTGEHAENNNAAADAYSADRATPAELVKLGQQDALSLLLETRDRLVLFKKPNCYMLGAGGPRIPPAAHVYTVLRSDVQFTHVTP